MHCVNAISPARVGTAVVQFARHMHQVKPAYALKFFQSQKALDAELQLYESDAIRQLLPPIMTMLKEGGATADGVALPPLLVVDSGEGLDEWFRRVKPDFLEAATVYSPPSELSQILESNFWIAHLEMNTTFKCEGPQGSCRVASD